MHRVELFIEGYLGTSRKVLGGDDLGLVRVPPSRAVERVWLGIRYFGEGVGFSRLEADLDEGLGIRWSVRGEGFLEVYFRLGG